MMTTLRRVLGGLTALFRRARVERELDDELRASLVLTLSVGVALAPAWLPAWRAGLIDPLAALRSD